MPELDPRALVTQTREQFYKNDTRLLSPEAARREKLGDERAANLYRMGIALLKVHRYITYPDVPDDQVLFLRAQEKSSWNREAFPATAPAPKADALWRVVDGLTKANPKQRTINRPALFELAPKEHWNSFLAEVDPPIWRTWKAQIRASPGFLAVLSATVVGVAYGFLPWSRWIGSGQAPVRTTPLATVPFSRPAASPTVAALASPSPVRPPSVQPTTAPPSARPSVARPLPTPSAALPPPPSPARRTLRFRMSKSPAQEVDVVYVVNERLGPWPFDNKELVRVLRPGDKIRWEKGDRVCEQTVDSGTDIDVDLAIPSTTGACRIRS